MKKRTWYSLFNRLGLGGGVLADWDAAAFEFILGPAVVFFQNAVNSQCRHAGAYNDRARGAPIHESECLRGEHRTVECKGIHLSSLSPYPQAMRS